MSSGTLELMLIGYARVSTLEQNLDLQKDALQKANCEKIYTDHITGAKASHPGLDECLAYARAGDTIVVWKLDYLRLFVLSGSAFHSKIYARGPGSKALPSCARRIFR